MTPPLELLEKLTEEERLTYMDKWVNFLKAKKTYEQAKSKINKEYDLFRKICEKEYRLLNAESLIENESSVETLHQLNGCIGRLIDLKENSTFVYSQYETKDQEFEEFLVELYEKYEVIKPERKGTITLNDTPISVLQTGRLATTDHGYRNPGF